MVLNRSRIISAVAASALFAIGGSAAQAQTPIDVNTTIAVPVVNFFGGTQTSFAASAFSFTDASTSQVVAGTLYSAVYSGGTGALNGNGLDFYYQFVNSASSTQSIETFSIGSFLGTTLSVGQVQSDIDGAGLFSSSVNGPGTVFRNFTGSGLTYGFGAGSIVPGGASSIMVVRSNATSFTNNGNATFAGSAGLGANATTDVIAPLSVGTAAPEPGSLALLGTSVLGVAGMVVRRRRSAK